MPERITSFWSAMPLRRRLVFGLLAVMVATLVVVAAGTYLAIRAWTVQQIDVGLEQGKEHVYADSRDRGALQESAQQWTSANASLFYVTAAGIAYPLATNLPGEDTPPVALSSSDAAELSRVPLSQSAGPVAITLDTLGPSRAVAVPGSLNGAPVTVVAATSVARATSVATRLLAVEIIAIVLALVAAGLVAAWFIRRSLRPLQAVTATATEVARLPLERGDVVIPARVPNPVPTTEVGQVGLAVNAMLDHVEASLQTRADTEDRLRRFVSDAGHELRTPLAAVRGYAELMRRGAGNDPEQAKHAAVRIEAAGSRMGMLVEDLLLLASLDEQRPLARDAVDVNALIDEAVAEAATAGPDHVFQVDQPHDAVVVVGDRVRLHQVVGNLLANATAHTPGGTAVTVTLRQSDDGAHIDVVDDGPGFPEDLLPRVTERFARGDASRSRATGGSGLGLAIVKAVVEAHGGSVVVGNRLDGPGAAISLVLPTSGPRAAAEVAAPEGTAYADDVVDHVDAVPVEEISSVPVAPRG